MSAWAVRSFTPPSKQDRIAVFKSLICTGTRRHPAACGTEQRAIENDNLMQLRGLVGRLEEVVSSRGCAQFVVDQVEGKEESSVSTSSLVRRAERGRCRNVHVPPGAKDRRGDRHGGQTASLTQPRRGRSRLGGV